MTRNSSLELYKSYPSKKLYESETASTLLTETVTGSHRFKVVSYSLSKGIGVDNCLTSATFVVGGYDWVVEYYPDGKTLDHKDYLYFYITLTSKDREVKARYSFTMLNQNGKKSTLICRSNEVSTFGNYQRWGFISSKKNCGFRMERKKFEEFLETGCFEIMCTITVVKSSRLQSTISEPAVVVPPSNLSQQLSQLFEMSHGTNITFEIGGKLFKAHKNVLAARSPVFRAQFFGPMNEKSESIKLDDIEAEVFAVFLHFIYSDSLPDLEDEDLTMYQHLLVAADRYEVDRLKLICESKLSENIEINNLATTLTLAEQHNCTALKAFCFKFISSPDILAQFIQTDGFEHFTKSCPSILKELAVNLSNKN